MAATVRQRVGFTFGVIFVITGITTFNATASAFTFWSAIGYWTYNAMLAAVIDSISFTAVVIDMISRFTGLNFAFAAVQAFHDIDMVDFCTIGCIGGTLAAAGCRIV